MTWKQLTERNCREWKLLAINPHDRHTWRSGVRSAIHAASQLSGRGPLMWMLPLYLHVYQKSDYDDEIDVLFVFLFFLFPNNHFLMECTWPPKLHLVFLFDLVLWELMRCMRTKSWK